MTIHMSLHREFNLMLADRIWKISGRKTDSLINMALYTKFNFRLELFSTYM